MKSSATSSPQSPAAALRKREERGALPAWLTALLLVFIALLPVAFLSAYSVQLMSQSLWGMVKANDVSAATVSAELVSMDLRNCLHSAAAIASLPALVDAVEKHDVDSLRERLKQAAFAFPNVDRATVLDTQGTLWCDCPMDLDALGKNYSERDYFRGVSAGWKPYVSEVFQRTAKPRPWVVAVATPIRNARGEVLGALVFHYRVEALTHWLQDISVGQHGHVFLLDRNGAVAAHPDIPDVQAKRYMEYAKLAPVGKALAGQRVDDQYFDPLAQRMMLATFAPVSIGESRWVVVAQQPLTDASAPLTQLRVQISMAAAITGMLAIGLVMALGRSRRAERESEKFFNVSLDMLCIASFDGYFVRMNRPWENVLGYTREELEKIPFISLVHPDDRATTEAEFAKVLSGGEAINFENRYRCKDGTYRWLMWNSTASLRSRRVYAAARDITGKKQAEQLLQEKNRQLEAAVQSEKEAHAALKRTQGQLVQSEKLASLGQLVAGVAHEINNPLAFVTNNLAVLQRSASQVRGLLELYQSADGAIDQHQPQTMAQIREFIQRIDLPYVLEDLRELIARSRDGLGRIQQIVKDLRDFSRQEAVGNLEEGTNLNESVQSSVNIAKGNAHKQSIDLVTDLGTLPLITCCPAKINQVLLNLLINAIEASPSGKKVTIRSRPDGDGVMIQIIDEGRGIKPAHLDKIFDPFFTTKPPGKGVGLGLSISHGIISEHGGRIEVQSEVDRGSTFTIHLPKIPPAVTSKSNVAG